MDMNTKGVEMMMGALRKLVPDHVWSLVESNMLGIGRKVASVEERLARIEAKLDALQTRGVSNEIPLMLEGETLNGTSSDAS